MPTFFEQTIGTLRSDQYDVMLANQLFLSTYGNVAFETSDQWSLRDFNTVIEKLQKFKKDEGENQAKRDKANLMSLLKNISKMLSVG